ncbi:hypothetical protein C2S53_008234 [Perilla frutescens var. hirtella]|uniref:mRNA-decapping enzyme-like protein n=1 Tax=Perilla frutescens var. hirtella TaxID=608512 RepID=A0AAD4PF96_PERFH|nr:hypothetical protein C2S53_008234 [Perilla frutescens var. hirtella]
MLKTKGRKLKPILDEKSTKLLNLTVLQRLDHCVQEILAIAAHVVIYELNTDIIEWNRKNVEGSLFVVRRNTQPRFQFIVMNRLNTENLVESLLRDFEYEVQGPYLLYRNHTEEINGIWFYNANECGEVADLFGRILNGYSKVLTNSKASPIKSEVEKDAPQEPSSTTTPNVEDVVDDRSFVNISSPYQSSTALGSAPPQIITLETLRSAPAPAPSPSAPILSIPENPESKGTKKCTTDLVKPLSFLSPRPPSPQITTPLTSSVPTASPLISPGNLKRPYGELFLLPFPPPPSPTQSLTPTSVPSPTYVPVISREKIRKALQLLIQDNQFIDIVYRAVVNAPEG